jgi:hypothetical protein
MRKLLYYPIFLAGWVGLTLAPICLKAQGVAPPLLSSYVEYYPLNDYQIHLGPNGQFMSQKTINSFFRPGLYLNNDVLSCFQSY